MTSRRGLSVSLDPQSTAATPYTSTRLSIRPGLPYEEVVQRYEAAVPPAPMADLERVLSHDGIDTARDLLAARAPLGLLLFYKLDPSPYNSAAGLTLRCATYLMGNPAIAEKMYRFNPAVMLYAPLRTVIHENTAGDVEFVIDRPSDLFGSFDDAEIGDIGRYLDSAVGALLERMKLPVPAELSRPA